MRTSFQHRKPNENWQCYRVDRDTWGQMGWLPPSELPLLAFSTAVGITPRFGSPTMYVFGGMTGNSECTSATLSQAKNEGDKLVCANVFGFHCSTRLVRSTVRLFYVIRTLHAGFAGGGFPCLYFESCPCLAPKRNSSGSFLLPLSVANRPICRTRG